jgi:hypothetical protein
MNFLQKLVKGKIIDVLFLRLNKTYESQDA